MDLKEVTRLVKEHFDAILLAFFSDPVVINYSDSENIIPQAFPNFRAIQYFDPSFNYYYQFYNFLNDTLDFVNFKIINKEYSKLVLSKKILTVDFIRQITIPNNCRYDYKLYIYNLITHLFAFLHECGHINIQIDEDKISRVTNHFQEYNCDYFGVSKILQYFFTLKNKYPDNYLKVIAEFESEEVFFKIVIILSLMIFYLECVSKVEIKETEDYPAIQKRFCHLVYKLQQQLQDNYSFLFKSITLQKFLADVFKSLDFIETNLFDKKDFGFDKLLQLCIKDTTLSDIQKTMTNSLKFKNFNE